MLLNKHKTAPNRKKAPPLSPPTPSFCETLPNKKSTMKIDHFTTVLLNHGVYERLHLKLIP